MIVRHLRYSTRVEPKDKIAFRQFENLRDHRANDPEFNLKHKRHLTISSSNAKRKGGKITLPSLKFLHD